MLELLGVKNSLCFRLSGFRFTKNTSYKGIWTFLSEIPGIYLNPIKKLCEVWVVNQRSLQTYLLAQIINNVESGKFFVDRAGYEPLWSFNLLYLQGWDYVDSTMHVVTMLQANYGSHNYCLLSVGVLFRDCKPAKLPPIDLCSV